MGIESKSGTFLLAVGLCVRGTNTFTGGQVELEVAALLHALLLFVLGVWADLVTHARVRIVLEASSLLVAVLFDVRRADGITRAFVGVELESVAFLVAVDLGMGGTYA